MKSRFIEMLLADIEKDEAGGKPAEVICMKSGGKG